MNKPIHQASVEIEVPFHDVDVMEIVWHGYYAKYFEIARCALLDKINYNYEQMRDSGYAWPIIDLSIRYIKPAVFRQTLAVNAMLVEWENRLKIKYLINDKTTGAKLVKGHTIQAAVNMATGTLCLESPKILSVKLGLKQ
jgi:acyl-CoA thioester hydrolase